MFKRPEFRKFCPECGNITRFTPVVHKGFTLAELSISVILFSTLFVGIYAIVAS